MKRKPYIIAIEGNDGAGKSTIVKLLSKYLKSKNYKVRVLRYNMSFTTLPAIKEGKRRKFSPVVNTLLHFLSVVDQQERLYHNTDFVIWDRYKYSVYSRGKARRTDVSVLNFILEYCSVPDITIYLDITPELSLKRLNGAYNYWESGQDIYPHLSKEKSFLKFQNNVREEFIKILSKNDNSFFINISDERTKRDIFSECVNILKKSEIERNIWKR